MNSLVTKRRVRLISRYAQSLSAREQEKLLELLKKKALLEKSAKLKGKVKPNPITMDAIQREIAGKRRESYKKKVLSISQWSKQNADKIIVAQKSFKLNVEQW